jgi:desulfoferrodoxin (superoxide reductase-like protein)
MLTIAQILPKATPIIPPKHVIIPANGGELLINVFDGGYPHQNSRKPHFCWVTLMRLSDFVARPLLPQSPPATTKSMFR